MDSAGQFIVFKTLFRHAPAAFRLRALTDVDLISIPAADFRTHIATDTALAEKIESLMSSLEATETRILAGTLQDGALVDPQSRRQTLRRLFQPDAAPASSQDADGTATTENH